MGFEPTKKNMHVKTRVLKPLSHAGQYIIIVKSYSFIAILKKFCAAGSSPVRNN